MGAPSLFGCLLSRVRIRQAGRTGCQKEDWDFQEASLAAFMCTRLAARVDVWIVQGSGVQTHKSAKATGLAASHGSNAYI